jgi:hypothetical protein
MGLAAGSLGGNRMAYLGGNATTETNMGNGTEPRP